MCNKIFAFIFALLLAATAYAQKKIYNINSYGAIADGTTVNTLAIQKAIDVCSASGGGVVLIAAQSNGKATYLTGTIILKNNVELCIDTGAILLGSTNYVDYQSIEPFIDGVGQSRGACLIGALQATNIAVTGKGLIDGQGDKWKTTNNPDFGRRPFMFRIIRSDQCLLQNINLKSSAAWMCNFDLSKNITLNHINIDNHVNANNDGIDIDACQNVVIKNCTINSADDAICFKSTRGTNPCQNVEVLNNDISSRCGGIKWGTESMGDFNNFTINGNYIHDTNLGGIKILTADGANIKNIRITNTRMKNVYVPIFICIKNRLRTYHDAPKRTVGSISDVVIDGVLAIGCRTAGIVIMGIPGQPVGPGIQLNNIALAGLGNNGTVTDAEKIPAENESAYPEVSHVGPLPAYGGYIRHAKGIVIKNLSIAKNLPDQRYALVFDDTDSSDATLLNFMAKKDDDGLALVSRLNAKM